MPPTIHGVMNMADVCGEVGNEARPWGGGSQG